MAGKRKTPYDLLSGLLVELKTAGWRQTGRGRFAPPFTVIGITPERIPASWWTGTIYPVYCFLDMVAVGRPSYWTEKQNAPWAPPTTKKVVVVKASEFIREVAAMAACGYLADGPKPVPVMGD